MNIQDTKLVKIFSNSTYPCYITIIFLQIAGDACDVGVSPTWTIGGWEYTIVQIAPNAAFTPPPVADDERQLVKPIRGTIIDVNLNGIFGKYYFLDGSF